ncbi:MAG: trigger factor [Solirubrobacteraceae bacterium]|nr:trigger factor [Solirubrobacteraceae bacterium]
MSGSEVIATTTELPESRVRLEATVSAELLQRSIERAAVQVGRTIRIPGFRAGKVPAKLVIQRVGREAIIDEAIRADLNDWYDKAIKSAKISPVGQPSVDLGELPAEGAPFVFSAEIGIVPTVADVKELGSIDVGRADTKPDEDAITAELEGLRDRIARLETVERAVENGDYVVIDYTGRREGEPFEGGEGKGQLLEVGAGRFIPGFDEQLIGLKAGEDKLVKLEFPEAEFDVTIHEVKAKQLPELDDEFALEVGGVDTLDELKKDIEGRLAEAEEARIERFYRLAVLDAYAKKAGVEVPDALAYEHAHQEFHRLMHRFEHQGISQDVYLQSVGKTHDEVVEEAKPAAVQQLRRQAIVGAFVDAEGLSATDEEIAEAVEPLAQQEKISVKKAIARLESRGQIEGLRRDLAEEKAVDLLVERANTVTVAAAKKADTAWTPTADEQAANPGIWAL